jgi:REP element-mobilizing transposase RayT
MTDINAGRWTLGAGPLAPQHTAMPTPRSELVDDEIALYYHLVSRCVRRSWLCGNDPYSGQCFDHRKAWIKARLYHPARYFAVEVVAYTIMSDHFHLCVRYDPLQTDRWDDVEVADRWLAAFPPPLSQDREAMLELHRDLLSCSPERLAHAHSTLGSMSRFMQQLKQPIARRANREDGCTGHFFEGRYYSGALLNDEAIIAAMAYIDLNPVRADIARSIEDIEDSSIQDRLAYLINTSERLEAAMAPLVSGITSTPRRSKVELGVW